MDISLDLTDQIACIRMDDGKKNAITPAAVADLAQALDEAEAKANALVLAGRPGSFCAGFDLATMTGGDLRAIGELGRGGGRLALRLYQYPKPLVAACTGHAFTIGALWLLAADTRIGEEGPFKLAMTETKMGMGLPAWAFELLEARIANTHFVPVCTQSKAYDPVGAIAAGFLDEVVPQGRAEAVALETASELAKLAPAAYTANKLTRRTRSFEIMDRDLGS
ncbi:MAG: crotonase/enoyl-CoA hydratase family protein [Myxococcota bacterium]|jgi:enoyl-CoA hydratase|nr:crotonase/enoyl-CoA hydratase family protein [Myxococcota bacterium]